MNCECRLVGTDFETGINAKARRREGAGLTTDTPSQVRERQVNADECRVLTETEEAEKMNPTLV